MVPYGELNAIGIAQAAGLRLRHLLFLKEVGTLVPDTLPVNQFKRVLDVACGSGSWALDFARLYPQQHVIGIDVRETLLLLAQEDARTANLHNVRFEFFRPEQRLPFVDNRFDFIHTGHSSEMIFPRRWPGMLREYMRILKPGGWLNLLDFEVGLSTSRAVNQYLQWLREAYAKVTHADPGPRLALTAATQYPLWLRQAGFVQVAYQLYPLDLGNQRADTGRSYIKYVVLNDPVIPSFLMETGVATAKEIQELQRVMREEVGRIDYCGMGMLISVVARKPASIGDEGGNNGKA